MSDWNTPALTSTYTSFLDGLKARDVETAALFANDAVSSMSNWPARAVRFNTTDNKFERRNAANNGWENLTINLPEAVTISDNLTVTGDITGASIDVSGECEAGYFHTTATTVPANGINEPSNNVLGLCSDSAVRWGITANILHRGTTALVTNDSTANFQIHHTSGPTLALIRSDTSVISGNPLGQIRAYGNDTTSNNYIALAAIMFDADGTHSAGDNPTRIEFQTTADGSETLRTIGCFDEAGKLGIGANVGAAPSYHLHVNSGATQNVAQFVSTGASANIYLKDAATTGDQHVRLKSVGDELHFHSGSTSTASGIFTTDRHLLLGHTTKLQVGTHTANLQVFGTSTQAGINISRWSANTSGPQLRFGKSRGAIGTQTALLNGDNIGRIMFYGSDGTDLYTSTFQILVEVDAATDFSGVSVPIATGSVPTRMGLYNTAIGSTSTRIFAQADNWGHWQFSPVKNDGNHNEYCIDIRAHNSTYTGNLIRFTDTDTSTTADQIVGGLEFATLDTGAVPTGDVLGRFIVDADDGTPHGRMKFIVGGSLRSIIHGNTGYFGIGSDENPTHALHVQGEARATTGLLVGQSTSFINFDGSKSYIQTSGDAADESTIAAGRWNDADASYGSKLILFRARSVANFGQFDNAANGVHSGDELGAVQFMGSDQASSQIGAEIFATCTQDWSDGSRGTQLNFATAPNGGTASTRMHIQQDGVVVVGNPTSAVTVAPTGSIEIQSDGAAPFIDFKRDNVDTQCRIIQSADANYDLVIKTGGSIAAFKAFQFKGNGGVVLPGATQGNAGQGIMCAKGYNTRTGYDTDSGNSGAASQNTENTFNFWWDSSSSDAYFYIDNTRLGHIDASTTSDYRIKREVTTLDINGIDRVKQLRPVSYKYTDYEIFKSSEVVHEGFIAHEVGEVIADACKGEKDKNLQSIGLAPLVATLTKAIQEAVAKIETLETKVAALEAK